MDPDPIGRASQFGPPVADNADPTVLGTRCQPGKGPNGPTPPVHEGCRGWWSGMDGSLDDAFVCGCPCHANGAGWPGWERYQRGE